MAVKTLLVGCGGSGIKSLMRFNELMSSNREWREDMSERIAYLVVDTEVDMVRKFEASVAKDMDGVTPSFCGASTPTEGYYKLSEITDRFAHKSAESLERLSKFWWFTPDGKTPFVADGIAPIAAGAGQCPPISYLSVWHKIDEIKEKVESLIVNMIKGDSTSVNPIAELQVYIVAGLAGGTGRGSWNTVAYAVKQVLKERYHSDVDIAGVFFDAQCFADVSSGAKANLGVNAITGFSEVSAWMKLSKGKERGYSYVLPNLLNPLGSPVMEIKHAAGSPNSSDRCPINEAYVICRKASDGSAPLAENKEYFLMAGSALYSLVTGAELFRAWKVNGNRGVQSMAALSFEVDSMGLRSFFQTRLRRIQLKNIIKAADEVVAGDVAAFLGDNDAPGSFFGQTMLDMSDVDNAMDSKLFGRIYDAMGAFDDTSYRGERGAFAIANKNAGKVGSVDRVVNELCRKINSDIESFEDYNLSAALGRVVNPQILGKDGKGFSSAFVQKFLSMVLTGSGLPDSLVDKVSPAPSLARANQFVKLLDNQLDEIEQKLGGECMVLIDGQASPVEDVETLESMVRDEIVNKSDREFNNIFGIPFNDDEINSLCSTFDSAVKCAAYLAVRSAIKGWLDLLRADLKKFRRRLGRFDAVLNEAARHYEEQERKDATDSPNHPVKTQHEAYLHYFVEENPVSMIRALPEELSTTNKYRRVLKPVMSEERVNKLMLNVDSEESGEEERCEAVFVDQNAICRELSEVWDMIPSGAEDDFEQEVLASKVIDVIHSIVIRWEFMEKRFSLEGVLKNNLKRWSEALKEIGQDEVKRNKFCDRMLAFAGFDPRKGVRDGKYKMPSLDKFREAILVSLMNNCRPWWMLRDGVEPILHTEVFAPIAFDGEDALKEALTKCSQRATGNGRPSFNGVDNDRGIAISSDKIIVYVESMIPVTEEEPFAQIASLDYCIDEEEIREKLETAELPQARTYFSLNDDRTTYRENIKCNGFLSPAFLAEPLAKLRWKPWKAEVPPSVREQDEDDVCRALLYAFLGVSAAADAKKVESLTGREGLEFFRKPFIAMGAREQFAYTRETMYLDGDGFSVLETSSLDIEDGTKIAVSVDNLFAFLVGDGRTGNISEKDREESKAEGRLHRENLLRELQDFSAARNRWLNDTEFKQLCNIRDKWIKEMARKATSDSDKEVWKRLQAFVADND